MVQSRGVSVRAPSKVNIHLAVAEKRPDGFHNLESVFAALDFADTLVFRILPDVKGRTELRMDAAGPYAELARRGQVFPSIPPEENLVSRAAALFRSETGFSRGITVDLVKRIPPGSGLGGGSSNAAAALLALNRLAAAEASGCSRILSHDELLDMASRLGSDVPFFVDLCSTGLPESPARAVKGRGEFLAVLETPPPLGVLLAFPGFASHTGRAYALLDEENRSPARDSVSLAAVAKGNWPPPASWDFYNDFKELFLCHGTEEEKKRYGALLAELQKTGASFTGLSGSGSACFALFDSPEGAEKAKSLVNNDLYVFQSTFFLRPSKTGSTIMTD